MYKLTYSNDKVKSMMTEKKFWDSDLEKELKPLLETLKKFGEVVGADFGVKPGVNSLVYEVKGKSFQLSYAVDAVSKEVKFYDFKMVSHPINWEMSLSEKLSSTMKNSICIPQIGDPQKFLKTIEFINKGINTSAELGRVFESNTKQDKFFARRGQYLTQLLIEIGLVNRVKIEGKSIYSLTDKGLKIANSSDQETRERLLVESLLGFLPIQMIIEQTTRGGKELTLELIQDIISQVSLGDCGGTTNPRRASSLRALVNWTTRWAGIPVCREGSIQLYIPYIYR
jgi:hypothetical protein